MERKESTSSVDSYVPREFAMQSHTDDVDGFSLRKEQPVNLKDSPILEEGEMNEESSELLTEKVPESPSCLNKEQICVDVDQSKSDAGISENQNEINDNEVEESKESLQKVIIDGAIDIESIINNLFIVLEDLKKSVTNKENIAPLEEELATLKKSSNNIIIDIKDSPSRENTIGLDLKQIVKDVDRCLESNLNGNSKCIEFENLRQKCDGILDSLKVLKVEIPTPPTTPVTEKTNPAQDSTESVEKDPTLKESLDNVSEVSVIKDSDVKSDNKTSDTSELEDSPSFVSHQVKKFDDTNKDDVSNTNKKGEDDDQEKSDSMSKCPSKENTEGIGNLSSLTVDGKGLASEAVCTLSDATTLVLETPTKTMTTNEMKVEEDKIITTSQTKTEKHITVNDKVETREETDSSVTEIKHISTDTSAPAIKDTKDIKEDTSADNDADGYHFASPPSMSVESESRPCGIDVESISKSDKDSAVACKEPSETDTSKSGLVSISEDIQISESKSIVTTSSDYKVITEVSSSASVFVGKNIAEQTMTDNLAVDSGTDDQMSSGTFSQDDSSPRFADLPTQINVGRGSKIENLPSISHDLQSIRIANKDRSLSMETRTTSINSDVSDQEIPPTTPRSDPTWSPTIENTAKFTYGEMIEKSSTDNMDIMTQSIYVGSETNDYNPEKSSESHQSTLQKLERKISSTVDESKITTTVEEKSSVYESVVKLSENVTENILEQTKIITKSTKRAVEDLSNKQKQETVASVTNTKEDTSKSDLNETEITATVSEMKSTESSLQGKSLEESEEVSNDTHVSDKEKHDESIVENKSKKEKENSLAAPKSISVKATSDVKSSDESTHAKLSEESAKEGSDDFPKKTSEEISQDAKVSGNKPKSQEPAKEVISSELTPNLKSTENSSNTSSSEVLTSEVKSDKAGEISSLISTKDLSNKTTDKPLSEVSVVTKSSEEKCDKIEEVATEIDSSNDSSIVKSSEELSDVVKSAGVSSDVKTPKVQPEALSTEDKSDEKTTTEMLPNTGSSEISSIPEKLSSEKADEKKESKVSQEETSSTVAHDSDKENIQPEVKFSEELKEVTLSGASSEAKSTEIFNESQIPDVKSAEIISETLSELKESDISQTKSSEELPDMALQAKTTEVTNNMKSAEVSTDKKSEDLTSAEVSSSKISSEVKSSASSSKVVTSEVATVRKSSVTSSVDNSSEFSSEVKLTKVSTEVTFLNNSTDIKPTKVLPDTKSTEVSTEGKSYEDSTEVKNPEVKDVIEVQETPTESSSESKSTKESHVTSETSYGEKLPKDSSNGSIERKSSEDEQDKKSVEDTSEVKSSGAMTEEKSSKVITEVVTSEASTVVKSTVISSEVKTSAVLSDDKLTEVKSSVISTEVKSTEIPGEASKEDTSKDGRSYSDVVKKVDKVDQSKILQQESESVAKEAVSEVLKSENVINLVESKGETSSRAKKLSYSDVLKSEKSMDKDPIADWGKPLGLPSPMRPGTPSKPPKREVKETRDEELVDSNKKKDKIEPVWMDLAYVPHHGASGYADVEYFKRVRARYYVFSGVEPSKEVFNGLLEAKKTWENKDQEVTIIPTYDTDVLGYWVAENEELLSELKIDLAPSASRCTINLQDHATSCAAYRLEF